MAQPATLFFDILLNGESVRSDRSDATAIKIGSHPKSHLHVEDSEVSRCLSQDLTAAQKMTAGCCYGSTTHNITAQR